MQNDIPFVPDTVLCRELQESKSVLFLFVACVGEGPWHPVGLVCIHYGKRLELPFISLGGITCAPAHGCPQLGGWEP